MEHRFLRPSFVRADGPPEPDDGPPEPFEQSGFAVHNDVIDASTVELLRDAGGTSGVQQRLDELGQAHRGVHLLGVTSLHPQFLALARDTRIVQLVADLIGSDLELYNSKFATKPPIVGAGHFAWHQDLRFFPHTNHDFVSVMVMLDDATPENGCMFMIPGSHHLGLLEHDLTTGECTDPQLAERLESAVALTPRTGGVTLHHGLTLHCSPDNRSTRPRRAVILHYRAADSYQLAGPQFSETGLLVSGSKPASIRCVALTVEAPHLAVPPHLVDAWHQIGIDAARWNREATE